MHPPMHLTQRMVKAEVSKLVFIVRDLDPEQIRRSFAAFGLAKPTETNYLVRRWNEFLAT